MAASLEIQIYSSSVTETMQRVEAALTPAGLSIFAATRIRQWLQERAEARFASEGDDASGKWLPLSDVTNKIRSQLGYPPVSPINVRTGGMETFVTQAAGDVGVDAFGVTYRFPGGSPGPDMLRKLQGAQHGGARQPARPVAAVNITDAAGVLGLLGDFILGPSFRVARRS